MLKHLNFSESANKNLVTYFYIKKRVCLDLQIVTQLKLTVNLNSLKLRIQNR